MIRLITTIKNKKIGLVSLIDGISTEGEAGKQVLKVFAALATNLKLKTSAGLVVAKARGRTGGRAPKISREEQEQMRILYNNNKISVNEICKQFNISRSTFYRAIDTDYTHKEAKK